MIPTFSEGRVQPLGVTDQSLEELLESSTLYSKPLRNSLLGKPEDVVTSALFEAYEPKIGKAYSQGIHRELIYPSLPRLRAELFYKKFPLLPLVIAVYLFAFLFPRLWLYGAAFFLHTLLLGLRSWILYRPPVSNLGETLLFVPWIGVTAGFILLLFFRRRPLIRAGSLLAGSLLSLALFGPFSLALTTVRPVLDSNFWLTVHVLMVVGSYGLFLLAAILGHFALFSKNFSLTKPLRQSIYGGTFLLAMGTFLGGVWAARSWGRFWDWDPKEAWAFISLSGYLILIHAERYKRIGPFGLAIGSILGWVLITFTWFGLNTLFTTGLHSYGFSKGSALPILLFLGAEIGLSIFFLCRRAAIAKKGPWL